MINASDDSNGSKMSRDQDPLELLRQVSDAPLARNFQYERCLLCEQNLQIGEGVILKDCFHVFCDLCLIRTIKVTIQYDVQIHCPQVSDDQQCSTLLQEREIRSLLSGEDFERYERKCMEFAKCADQLDEDELTQFLLETLIFENELSRGTCFNQPPAPKPNVNFEELLTLSDALLVRNKEVTKCLLCDEDIQVDQGVILKDCFHFLCDGCFIGTINGALDENIEVRCPFMEEDGQRCAYVIQEREIRSVMTPEDYAKYEQRCLEVAEGGFTTSVHCVTPNCKGWVVLDPNRNPTSFTCEVCSSVNCISCKAIHPGKSCVDHLADVQKDANEKLGEAAIKEMLEKRDAMLCPGCKRLITKNGGCDFIRCIKCKFEICWPTRGPRWGPGGEGDDSGGCHCTQQKRCHPECSGCHLFVK